jgi:predicted HTH domain antitoxin
VRNSHQDQKIEILEPSEGQGKEAAIESCDVPNFLIECLLARFQSNQESNEMELEKVNVRYYRERAGVVFLDIASEISFNKTFETRVHLRKEKKCLKKVKLIRDNFFHAKAPETGLAQSVERWPFKPVVVGSSPISGDPFFA